MRLYIKGNYSKQFPYGYLELAGRMWFPEENQNSYSNVGNNESLQNNLSLSLMLRKFEVSEEWIEICKKLNLRFHSLRDETISLDFEDAEMSDYRERGDSLRIVSTHKEILTVDKRAMYIMAIEVATAIDGQISEDNKETWLTIEEFKMKHQEILSLTFDEANELSLKEILTMEAIEEPLWDELDKQREEYIKIHGEPVWDDEE